MPNLRESNIEDFAYEYLYSYYSASHTTKNVLIGKAEKTKQDATADGLAALKTAGGDVFIATLNTRHSPKLAALLTKYKNHGISRLRYGTALFLFAFALVVGKITGHWALLYVVPVLVALVGLACHSLLEERYLKRKVEQLVDDLKRIPANEQWLGLSVSSLTFRNNALATHLLNVCKRRGIGLITVGKRAKVVQLHVPRTIPCRRGDFLSYYAAEDQIRKALNDNSVLRVA
ncbi:hypothetical protein [Pontibacter chitinilyticus]|uniref:hypothetical protein n=1 Tax=Pontibacter chitinilyticus TaxID=2674989 RepID=UPI00321962E2